MLAQATALAQAVLVATVCCVTLVAIACSAWVVAKMDSKAKIVALCGVCSAISLLCLLLASFPALKWGVMVFAVVASIAVCLPMIASAKLAKFSILVYVASAIFGVVVGATNIIFVAPILFFFVPFCMVKVFGESVVLSKRNQQIVETPDPFDIGEPIKTITLDVVAKRRWPTWLRWVLYYVLLWLGIGISLGGCYLFTQPLLFAILENRWFWLVIVLLHVAVVPYNFFMDGVLLATKKLLKRTKFM